MKKLLVCLFLISLISVSTLVLAQGTSNEFRPSTYQKVKAWAKGLFNINKDIIQTLEEKYGDIESIRYKVKSNSYVGNYRVCGDGESEETGCKPRDYRNFEELDKMSTSTMITLVKKPDKLYRTSEVDYNLEVIPELEKYGYAFPDGVSDYIISADLCLGTNEEFWESNYPNIIIKNINSNCKTRVDFEISSETNMALFIAKNFRYLGLNVRKTRIDGREVIEFYKKENPWFSHVDEHEVWIYLDAKNFKPIKVTETTAWKPYSITIDGKERVNLKLDKRENVYEEFELNDVSDDEFIFPSMPIGNFPAINDKTRCIVDQELERKMHDQLWQLGAPSSKEEFNAYESLRVSIPTKKCKGEKPRSYEDYLKEQGY